MFEEEYENLITKSWKEPLEQVNMAIAITRKEPKQEYHSRRNHDYMTQRFGCCVYCLNKIPIKEEEKEK